MRILNHMERKKVAGGDSVAPFIQTGPLTYVSTYNGFQTTVVCKAPITISYEAGISMTGKVAEAQAKGQFTWPADCTVHTLDTHTGIETVCKGESCTTINHKTGEQRSEAQKPGDDVGLLALAEAEGMSLEELVARDNPIPENGWDDFSSDSWGEYADYSGDWADFTGNDTYAGSGGDDAGGAGGGTSNPDPGDDQETSTENRC